MDKLEMKQDSLIQTQCFIPVEIDTSVVLHVWESLIFSLVPSDSRNTRSICPMSVFTAIGQTLNRTWYECSSNGFLQILHC